jgi:hypothetical protein
MKLPWQAAMRLVTHSRRQPPVLRGRPQPLAAFLVLFHAVAKSPKSQHDDYREAICGPSLGLNVPLLRADVEKTIPAASVAAFS